MANYKFWGHHQHSLDSKNRVAIPAKFREQLGKEKLIVTESFDGCLVAFPEPEWNRLEEKKLAGLDFIESDRDREIERMFFGSLAECSLDKQGRIGLTQYLVDASGLTKEVVFKGVRNRFELWDRKKWEAHKAAYKKREASGQP